MLIPATLRWISKVPVPFELHTPGTVFHFGVYGKVSRGRVVAGFSC